MLFGDADPGGRLAESIPEHVAQLPADRNFPGLPRRVEYREGLYVGYRFHDSAGVPARFPFGHGMSYTTFEWSTPELVATAEHGVDVEVRLQVTNTGGRAGSDVVQVYVRDVESSVHRPDKELKGFAKVHLEPGETADVVVALDRRSFAVWDVAAHDWLVESGDFEILVARSSVDVVATLTHHIDSGDELGPAPSPRGVVATDDEFTAMLGGPVPQIPATRPFHRNSTLGEIETTRVGRVIAAQVLREGLKRSAQEFPDPDEATMKMVSTALREGPVRALVLLSGGVVTFPMVDAALDALNGDWATRRLGCAGSVEELGHDRLDGGVGVEPALHHRRPPGRQHLVEQLSGERRVDVGAQAAGPLGVDDELGQHAVHPGERIVHRPADLGGELVRVHPRRLAAVPLGSEVVEQDLQRRPDGVDGIVLRGDR